MRSILDGAKIYDTKFVQGVFWGTVFQNITGNVALPDDPEVTYVYSATGATVRTITLPRLIGNIVYGGQTGLTSAAVASGALNGLYLEILNASTVAANTLQAANAAGDQGGANVGGTIAIGSANVATMGQYQVINGQWFRIL